MKIISMCTRLWFFEVSTTLGEAIALQLIFIVKLLRDLGQDEWNQRRYRWRTAEENTNVRVILNQRDGPEKQRERVC